MKVVVHGFGTFPLFFYYVMRYARTAYPHIEWAIILTTDHYESLFKDLLGADRVCLLGHNVRHAEPASDYPCDLFRDIEAEKRHLKHKRSEVQRRYALSLYGLVVRFMLRFSPDVALVSQVEGFDGKAFIAAGKACGARVVVPTRCRNLGGGYFAPDDLESLPDYADATAPGCREAAEKVLRSFRASPTIARPATELRPDDEFLDTLMKPFAVRAFQAMNRMRKNGLAGFEIDLLRVAFLNNLPRLRDAIWGLRKWWNQRYCDIRSIEQLPERFIYYPLQYSPESSINTPAPYFLDQLRAIDAIRFSMPSNFRLVVKEHPSCILLRSSALVRKLQRTAGVVVAHYSMSSHEIIRRAALTISVTGTATLEAALFGKRALVLGGCMSASIVGSVAGLDRLGEEIAAALKSPPSDGAIVEALARLYSVRHEFVYGSPEDNVVEATLTRRNVGAFTDAFVEHCSKLGLSA